MDLKTENVTVLDCNTVANGLLKELTDIDAIERALNTELSSADLLRIDSAILSNLRKTKDFSRNLLHQLEQGKFETVAVKPPKSLDFELKQIQENAMIDITLPLQNMFDEMVNYVSEALV